MEIVTRVVRKDKEDMAKFLLILGIGTKKVLSLPLIYSQGGYYQTRIKSDSFHEYDWTRGGVMDRVAGLSRGHTQSALSVLLVMAAAHTNNQGLCNKKIYIIMLGSNTIMWEHDDCL